MYPNLNDQSVANVHSLLLNYDIRFGRNVDLDDVVVSLSANVASKQPAKTKTHQSNHACTNSNGQFIHSISRHNHELHYNANNSSSQLFKLESSLTSAFWDF